jgi:syntaxin 1B/2/3
MDRLAQLGRNSKEKDVKLDISAEKTNAASSSEDKGTKEFYSQNNDIKSNIQAFESTSEAIRKLHELSLQTTDSNALENLSNTIQTRTSENDMLGKNIGDSLKALTTTVQEQQKNSEINASGARLRFNLVNSTSQDFVRKIQIFQNMQTKAKSQNSENLKRQLLIVNPAATSTELEQVASADLKGMQFFDAASRQNAQKALEKMAQRQKSIEKLAKSLECLHKLFLDMQRLIEMQGKMIDRIDENVEAVADYTETAAKDLDRALEHQKAAWKSKMMFLILIIVVALIVLVGFSQILI